MTIFYQLIMITSAPALLVVTCLAVLLFLDIATTRLLGRKGVERNRPWLTWVDDIAEEEEESEMEKRPPVADGDEQDVVTGWRHRIVWRPGEVSGIKRRIRRRERHIGKHRIRKDGHE